MILPKLLKRRRKKGTTLTGTAPSIIFETNFASDTGFTGGGSTAGWDPIALTNFDGFNSTTNAVLSVNADGVGGSNALRLTYDDLVQPTLAVGKHLTGNKATGYDELYIRYNVKLPPTFKTGGYDADENGNPPNPQWTYETDYWKWMRLWQNTEIDPQLGWTENRVDSGYIVINFGASYPYGPRANITWSENYEAGNVVGSSGGPRQKIDYWESGGTGADRGWFENVGNGAWTIDRTDGNYGVILAQPPDWHTLEFHVRLATTTSSDDGLFEMFFDGVDQGQWIRIQNDGSPLPPARTGLPTARDGSGLNWLGLFDNLTGWNASWYTGEVGSRVVNGDNDIRINDVVVSRTRIGHAYVAGNTNNVGAGAT